MGRKPCCDKVGLRRGAWTMEEDQKLINFILINGIQCWRHVSKLAGLKRCGKSCRLRWTNYLRPDVKRGSFTEAEEDQIIELHSQLGNRWSKIASHFPGRTDNEIKNHWNTGIKKRLKLLGLDPLTHNPIIQHVPDQDSNISGEVDADEVNKATEITKNQEDRHLELSVKDEEKQNSTNEMLNLWESIEEGGEQMKVGEAKPSSRGRSSSNSFMSIDDTHNSTSAELTELCWDVPIDSFPSWEELYFLGDLMPFVNYP